MPTLREAIYARHLNRAFKRLVKAGIKPTYQKAVNTLRGLLGRDKEGATLDPVLVKDKHAFPLEGFNNNLRDIEFDLEGLFESCTFLAHRHLETSIVVQEATQDIIRQAGKVSEKAERELLTAGSNFLDAIVIRFSDLENIDQAETTADINLEDGYVVLSTVGGADRVMPPSLPEAPIEIETLNNDAVVLPGGTFRAIFTDTLAAWQVKTAGDKLRFRFDLRKPLLFNRFRLETPDEGATVDLRLSTDGLNFIRPAPIQTVAFTHVNMLFEEFEARYVELEITKPVPENQQGNVFTIQSVSMYTTGYKNSDVLVTKALAPENQSLVKLLALDIDAETPQDTSVDVEVASIDSSGTQGTWRPVKAKIIDFTKTAKGRVTFRANPTVIFASSPALGTTTARGLTEAASYNSGLGMNDVWGSESTVVFPGGVPSNIDERSLRLYRVDNWKVDTQSVNESVQVINRMAMEAGEKRKLYVQIIDEVHDITAATAGTTLDLNREVINGSNVALSNNEDAQIVRIHGTLDATLNSSATFSGTVTVVGDGSDKVVTVAGTLPSFAPYFDKLFIPGIGEVDIITVDITNNVITVDNRPDYTDVLGGALSVRFQSRNLLPLLQSVADKTVTLTQSVLEGERVTVTYNSPMLRTQEDIIKSSLVVRSSIDPTRLGIIGIDYRIRDNELELLSTTRLPVQGTSTVYPITLEFAYNRLKAGPTTYTVWCHVPDGANRLVNIAQPIRLFSDEQVTWMDQRGRVLNMEGLESMTLAAGWHRFTVVGHKAITEHGDIDQASALWQILSLESAGGSYIFRPENGYFDSVTGFRDPLVPAGRFYMERQALLNDREHFAYEDGAIMSTLRLDNPPDAVRLEPGNTSILPAADYKLEYDYYNSKGVSQVKVRLTLNKDPSAPTSVTPLIRGLQLRFT